MPATSLVILYVENPPSSATFYRDLFGRPPVEQSATFATLPLDGGPMLGLWSRHTATPPAALTGGGAEIAFTVGDDAAVDALHAEWSGRGVTIAQPPTDMEFGRTLVGLDPDGHRLRVYARPAK